MWLFALVLRCVCFRMRVGFRIDLAVRTLSLHTQKIHQLLAAGVQPDVERNWVSLVR